MSLYIGIILAMFSQVCYAESEDDSAEKFYFAYAISVIIFVILLRLGFVCLRQCLCPEKVPSTRQTLRYNINQSQNQRSALSLSNSHNSNVYTQAQHSQIQQQQMQQQHYRTGQNNFYPPVSTVDNTNFDPPPPYQENYTVNHKIMIPNSN